jgi:Pentapeptide repeats (8 copies)
MFGPPIPLATIADRSPPWARGLARYLSQAHLSGADLTRANLTIASLLWTDLTVANLTGADLTGADLTGALLSQTVFGFTTALTGVKGLDHCHHNSPSIIDFETLKRSGPLPKRSCAA